jgi:hypothetical protein
VNVRVTAVDPISCAGAASSTNFKGWWVRPGPAALSKSLPDAGENVTLSPAVMVTCIGEYVRDWSNDTV